MDKISFDVNQLKISIEEIDEVLADLLTEEFPIEPSARGNDRKMFVGPVQASQLCEIGVEFVSDNEGDYDWHIFHAMHATSKWRDAFYAAKGM